MKHCMTAQQNSVQKTLETHYDDDDCVVSMHMKQLGS